MFMMNIMFSLSIIPLILSMFLLKYSLFISINIPLINFISMSISISIMIDWMSMMFLFTVMMISSMILMFSMEYIPLNVHKQFSLMLILFVFSMSLLILSNNLIFILLGWDGLGLTSYILVIHYQNFSSASSGSITIFTNRLGDIMIILTLALLISSSNWNFNMNKNFSLLILILLISAACSKSAQFPFSAWLPAAMAAPTPISALVHSSTLVTAGIYLLIRIMNYPHPTSMLMMLIISSMTMIYASLSANWEMDMKKIIALSTLSQIAMMLFAIAIGMISMAFFHLIIHAMFKSLMFLCAGIIIHSSNYQDMRMMSTMMINSPIVFSIFGISSMALMGIPFMSGFFSKDPIIENLMISKTLSLITILMILSMSMTSMYSIRLISMSMKFYMKNKPDVMFHSNNLMETSIIIMTPMSIFTGSTLSWMLIPEQISIIPLFMKMLIIISITLGMMISLLFSFTSKLYLNMGHPSINMWFNYFISTIPSSKSLIIMTNFFKNDNEWQEKYGPTQLHSNLKLLSTLLTKMSFQMMFILMILTLYPILIMLF